MTLSLSEQVDELLKRNAELTLERDAAVSEMQMEQYECVRAQEDADELRRERDEARAALVEAERVAEGVVHPARDIARMRRERDEARRLLSAVTDEIEKATTERIRLPQHVTKRCIDE